MKRKKSSRKVRGQERSRSKRLREDFLSQAGRAVNENGQLHEVTADSLRFKNGHVGKKQVLDELERLSVLNASKSNLKDYIKNMIDMVSSFVIADVVSVKLFDEANGDICYRYITGRNGEFIDEKTITLEEEFSQKTVLSKELFFTSNIGREDHFLSIASFPLLFRGNLLGVFSLLFRESIVLNQESLSGLKVCAANLALMIQNVRLYSNLAGNHFNIIRALVVSLEARDRYTHGHSQRVTEYALQIAHQMGCSKREIKLLSEVAPLHDIGKIAISDTVLNKVRRLTDEEFMEIKSHSTKGSIMLQALGFDKESVQIVRWHHEAYDGRGYPDRLKGEEIPLLARVLCLADAFDAMTSDRPYRGKLSKAEAYEEIEHCAGTQFCPKVV
ncbi:MAG: HD domain-containing protein, partial [Candidatus Omnitrophica bacterium]|nr:HD domain-containing protein [Candidatus Omnitrophota bacterium]